MKAAPRKRVRVRRRPERERTCAGCGKPWTHAGTPLAVVVIWGVCSVPGCPVPKLAPVCAVCVRGGGLAVSRSAFGKKLRREKKR